MNYVPYTNNVGTNIALGMAMANNSDDEELQCPKCKSEDIEYHCKNCGNNFEIEEDDLSGWKIFGIILIIFAFFYLAMTIMAWLFDGGTLIDMFKSQYEFIINAFKRIW